MQRELIHLILTQFDCIEIQSLTEEKIMSVCNFPFTADKTVKNRALIVSVENFYPGAGLNNRNGVRETIEDFTKSSASSASLWTSEWTSKQMRSMKHLKQVTWAHHTDKFDSESIGFAWKRLCQIWNLHIHSSYSLTLSSIFREQEDGQRLFCGCYIQSRWGGCCVWRWRMCCETGWDLQLLWRSFNGRQEQTLSDPGTFCENFLTDKLLWPALLEFLHLILCFSKYIDRSYSVVLFTGMLWILS